MGRFGIRMHFICEKSVSLSTVVLNLKGIDKEASDFIACYVDDKRGNQHPVQESSGVCPVGCGMLKVPLAETGRADYDSHSC